MKNITKISLFLVVIVIVLGAYTRLTDAGLGCPDWPGCYGFIKPPLTEDRMLQAESAFPNAPIDHAKAWNEMIHRYAAGILGLLIFAITVIAIRRKIKQPELNKPFKHPIGLGALIIFQAALGMWTVTMMLQPAIVMAHLLGGFTTFTLLALLYLRESEFVPPAMDYGLKRLLPLAWLVLIAVLIQIALGGWVAANYAALACVDLPICQGNWTERLNFTGAFSLVEAETYEFGVHTYDERLTMHVSHRIGAIVVLGAMLVLLAQLWRNARSRWFRSAAAVLTALLFLQITLGVLNVVLSLPLLIAVAHNAVGALLLVSMAILVFALKKLSAKEATHG
ncbi:COX15/CtaA family protein [Aliidiomarina celeris]|uniref:COX15/CtaA family protein n=1 Tax=Aliidiomarina celeris TaxID=2249428 RepID=UPI000DEAF2A3|nr:COX15/CtaA family protein [Aliidiomarina celeris]